MSLDNDKHVETVVLLSKLHADQHNSGLKDSNLYIAQVK